MAEMKIGRKRVRPLPTVERVRELLSYDPLTGDLRWKVDRGGCKAKKAGDLAGTWRKDGYLIVSIDSSPCLGQRLAWVIMKGEWPEDIVDHEDTDPGNNRWKNLRLAKPDESAWNKGTPISNTSGHKNIRIRKGRYLVQITKRGKAIFVGSYPDLKEAQDALKQALAEHHGEFARAS